MRSRELQQVLALEANRPLSDVDQRCRQLRNAEEIRSGPRGFNALELNPDEALMHVLVLVSRRAPEALTVARRLKSLEPILHPIYMGLLPPVRDYPEIADSLFGAMLAAMIPVYEAEGIRILSFELAEHGYYACVNINHIKFGNIRLLYCNDVEAAHKYIEYDQAKYEAFDRHVTGGRFFVSGDILQAIAKKTWEATPLGVVLFGALPENV